MGQAYSVIDGKIVYCNSSAAEIRLLEKITAGKTVHFSLVDPEKRPAPALESLIKSLYEAKTDVLLVGGSSGVTPEKISGVYNIVKKNEMDLDVILFPNDIGQLSGRYDAVLYMNCSNSRKDWEKLDATVYGVPHLRENFEKAIPLTYLIVEPGELVGWVADAHPLPRKDPRPAIMHAKAAELRGSRWIYLEAGSGAKPGMHEAGGPELIRAVKDAISIPLIVGGGIRTPEAAKAVKMAGANGIVTGNIIEDGNPELMKEIIKAVHS